MSPPFSEVLQVVGLLAATLAAFGGAMIWTLRKSMAQNGRVLEEYQKILALNKLAREQNEKSLELQAEANRLMAELINALRSR